jgi:hypothetical protein
VDRRERRRQAFDRGCRQLGEQRQRAQQRDLHHGHRSTGVEAEQGAPADRGRQRQDGRHPQQRHPVAPQVDQQRHQQRAQCEPGHRRRLHQITPGQHDHR